MTAVIGEEGITVTQVGGDGGLYRFLPQAGVQHAGHAAFFELAFQPGLEGADNPHVSVKVEYRLCIHQALASAHFSDKQFSDHGENSIVRFHNCQIFVNKH
jgi:hypothetical protein